MMGCARMESWLRWNVAVVAWLAWVHVSLVAGLTPDGLALIEFKNALVVKSPLLESWDASDAVPCLWGGVNCTDSGRMRNITLVAQEPMLEGSISPSLGKLQFLECLVLDYNRLTRTIPPELGNLTRLRVLCVAFNNLIGGIPSEIGNCDNFEEFVVWNNLLFGTIPHAMSKNLKLTHYDVNFNNFSGEIPSLLGKLPSLLFLDLQYNSFIGKIPTSLRNLNKMWWLVLHANFLTGPIPDGLLSTKNLSVLLLNFNALTGEVPSSLSRMVHLSQLGLSYNNLSGPIPHDLGSSMPNLTHVELSRNSFNGTLPDGLCDNGKFVWLTISWNRFEGAIPLSLAGCTSLKIFGNQDNKFTSIPDYFGQNSSLEEVYAACNHFVGHLPLGFGANSTLVYLDLSENRFTGEISILDFPTYKSSEVGLSNLQKFHLECNKLNMFNPSIYLGFAFTLTDLVLAENPWNAPIAFEIGSLTVLRVFNLSYGGHTGPIPSSLGQLAWLEVLDLSHNNLTGEVPSLLRELMVSLTSVNIFFNRLTGPLPRAWVKFLVVDPSSFQGNPGLCLEYDANDLCIAVSRPSEVAGGKGKLRIWVIVGMVLGAIASVLLAYVAFHFWRCRLMQRSLDASKEVLEMNLSNEKWSLTFDDIMSATKT